MDDLKKIGVGPKKFCITDIPDVPPWVKRAVVEKVISEANELFEVNRGAAGVWIGEQDCESTSDYTGHHRNKVFDYHDIIQASAARVDELMKINPRLARLLHGDLAEPERVVLSPSYSLTNTKSATADNPLHFDKREMSAPQREKVKEEKYRMFDVFLAAGIIHIGKK